MENKEKKHLVHNVVILDESGSMMSIKDTIIDSFNEIVQTIKGVEGDFPEQYHVITFVTFNGLGQKVLHFNEPVSKLNQLNSETYSPNASTPLYDAMGFALNKVKDSLTGADYHVLVTVLTDGEEMLCR